MKQVQTMNVTKEQIELLDVIDDVIVNNILGNHNEPDKEGILLQRIYDQIFNQN